MEADPHNALVERRKIARSKTGPLSSLRFAVKDNVAVEGCAFTAGHPLFAERKAGATAPSVQSLLDGGAAFIGMTQTDAGGLGASTPQTANPNFPDLIVGGSSGGSAAAITAGYCDFAVGTDTGGSVRIPAACTEIAAFKPTYGRVSNDGVFPLTPQLDHVGLLAADLAILEQAALVLIGGAPNAPKTDALKIAVEIDRAGIFEGAIAAELDRVAETLAEQGHTVERVPVPGRENLAEAHGVIVLTEAANFYAELMDVELEQLGKAAQAALRHSELLAPEGVEAAWEWVRAASDRMQTTLAKYDALISPTLPVPPPRADGRRVTLAGGEVPVVVAMTMLTCLANLTGNPVVAFPNPHSTAAPRTSLQMMGSLDGDEKLLAAAARVQGDLRAGK